MLVELLKAHQENDRAVMEVYGMEVGSTSESDSLAVLFNLFKVLKKAKI